MIDIDRIRLRRVELRLTQADVGKAIGQDQAYISKIERGQVTGMTVSMLERLARALRIDVAMLIRTDRPDSEYEPTARAAVGGSTSAAVFRGRGVGPRR